MSDTSELEAARKRRDTVFARLALCGVVTSKGAPGRYLTTWKGWSNEHDMPGLEALADRFEQRFLHGTEQSELGLE